jgi:hypothetical protein
MSQASGRSRRWFSYRLRSLFVLISFAAIGVARVAHERRQSKLELEFAEQLQARYPSAMIELGGRFDHYLTASRRALGGGVRRSQNYADPGSDFCTPLKLRVS